MVIILFYYDTFIGGSSHWSGPNLGNTMRSPLLFFVGFVKVHSVGFPKVDSHTGLISVKPVSKSGTSKLLSKTN